MSAQGTSKRSVARSGQTCTNCRTRKVKCERTDAAEGLALPPCKRCAKDGCECELYTGDGRTHTAQRSLAAQKRAEIEEACAGFLTLFANLYQIDDPQYPRDTQREYLGSLVKDFVPNIAKAAPEFRAQAGLAEEAKRICDLFVGTQDLFPADGSKLEEVREWTRRWVKSASRFHKAWTALLVTFLSLLLDYPSSPGLVRKNLRDVGFGIPIISGPEIFIHWNGREERHIEPHLSCLEESCKAQPGPSREALESAQREAVTAYQKSLCEGVTGLRFENGVLAETIGETSRKRRGRGRAGSAVVEAAQQALPQPGGAPEAPIYVENEEMADGDQVLVAQGVVPDDPILIEDEEMPDADEPFVHNSGTDTSGAFQVQVQDQTDGFDEDFEDFLAAQEENPDFALGTDDFEIDLDKPPAATTAAAVTFPVADIPPAPALVQTTGAVANLEVAPLHLQAQPYEVPEVYQPMVLQQQDLQQQQHLFLLPQQQQHQHQQQQQQQHMMQQVGNFAMPANTSPYTQPTLGMSMNMGMGQAGWQQTTQLQYQQAFGNAVYTPVSGNLPAGMGVNVGMPQQQMAMPQQQMEMPMQQQQQQYPPALYYQLLRAQQNAWMYAQPQ